ncbi:unnamed protein product [Hymenolepis diminuta]|uniref:C2H2-type domain-containing protein n=1 Tax=Hymenolepis diminuta TaxID=6216 RepID=A0A0R3SSD1_HYMDI|nr:unnamed protein product [Hymenolepis diminuta]
MIIGSRIRWVDPASLEVIQPKPEAMKGRSQGVTGNISTEISYGDEAEFVLKPDIDGHVVPKNEKPEVKKESGSPISKSVPKHCQTLPRSSRGRPKKQKRATYLHDRSEKGEKLVETWIPSDDDSDFNPHETGKLVVPVSITTTKGAREICTSKDVYVLSFLSGVHNYRCPDCGRGYYYYMKLHSHMRRVHNFLELRDADCRCPVCQEIFLVDFLPGHIKDSHKHFPAELCYFCDTSFPSAELTQQHIQSHHLSDTMYKCDHCERVFVWKKYLRQHIRQEHPSGGTVFSMRNNFHSERTSLTVVCDKQQQGLLGKLLLFLFLLRIIESAERVSNFLALIDSKSQAEEAKALESSVEQVSSTLIAMMDSSAGTEVKPEEPKQQQEVHKEEPKDPLIIVKRESPTSNGENDYVSVQP